MREIELLKQEVEELENVEDQEEDVVVTSNLFSISSFGVDYPVETLVSRMEKGSFYIPSFQRSYVWSLNQASRFIESLLLGLPVPGVFLFKEADGAKHLVIDGQQRLRSLQFFYDGVFQGREFKLTGLESEWQGKTAKTLSDDDKTRLDDAVVHATVFKQDLPEGEINSVYEVFERINTGGVKLSPQEIRSCICHGNFNEFLHELNENEDWRYIYGPKSKRLKDIEIILRFFAFFESIEEYRPPMKHFLNDYMKKKRYEAGPSLQQYRDIFERAMKFFRLSLGDRPFRPDRSLNTAVFDAVAPVIAKKLSAEPELDPENTRAAYNALLEDDFFISGYTRATADAENVKRRVSAAKKAFAEL